MARQSKKIAKKIQPKKKVEPENKKPDKKVGKDYFLIVIMMVTIVFMILGWPYFEPLNRGLYVTLTLALVTTYIRRHAKLTEKQDYWVEKVSQVSIGISIVFFAILAYYQHFAD